MGWLARFGLGSAAVALGLSVSFGAGVDAAGQAPGAGKSAGTSTGASAGISARLSPGASAGLPAQVAALAAGSQQLNLTQYVNPFIGTQYGGNTFPGATYPFGMVQWSPDNSGSPGGYDYGSSTITGFSLTHISGAGCSIFGDLPFIPFAGAVTQSPVASPGAYAMSYSHTNETASPGYYAVKLNSGVQVQLSATARTGYGRFSFPANQPASILINAGGSANGDSGSGVAVEGRHLVLGSATSGHFCGAGNTYTVYFAAQFAQPFVSSGTWNGSRLSAGSPSASGTQTGAYLSFAPGSTVDVKVGVSYVSEQGALANLKAEDPGWGLAQVRSRAQAAWNKDLNLVQVTGGAAAQLQTFYTALYHAFLSPTIFSDANGQYIGFDGKVHNAGSATQYANFSGWDIYRSEMPLLAFLMPTRASHMIQSLVRDGQQGGQLPKWPVANGYTGVMVGDSADPIISTAYALGARQFNTAAALRLMVAGATEPGSLPNGYQERPGLRSYLKLGYVPSSRGTWATSATEEYAIDDFSIGQFAKALGQPAGVYDPFLRRGQNWQDLFNPRTGFIQPRTDGGAFVSSFAPTTSQNYVEGSAYQYRWLVPQDFGGLSAALGGPRAAVTHLNHFFTQLNAGPQSSNAWMGNEPCITAPWAYDFAGNPAGTQQVVRNVVNQLYQPTPGGLPGNDDLGTMSAWYVWAALGMYPEVPGTPGFALASPLFAHAVVHWSGGQRVLVISGNGANAGSPYVQSMTLDGRPYAGSWLTLASIAAGPRAVLGYDLSSAPQGPLLAALALPRRSAAAPGAAPKYVSPPSFTYGLAPALGFATHSTVKAAPGTSVTFSVGLQAVGATAQPYHLALTIPQPLGLSQVALEASSGTGALVPLTVAVPRSAAPGIYPLQVSFTRSATSAVPAVPPVTVDIVVSGGGSSLFDAYNNVGVSNNSAVSAGNFDGGQRSYSASALRQVGIATGATFTADGAAFRWPMFAQGTPDNIEANGQTVPLSGSGSRLVFVGAASNGPTQGTGTITYTDGSTQSFELGFSDWTLGGGGGSVSFGNTVVAKSSYRNTVDSPTGKENVTTYLFAASTPLLPGKTVASVTLPQPANQGQIHVFLMGFAK